MISDLRTAIAFINRTRSRTSSIRRNHLKEMRRGCAWAWWKRRKETKKKKGEKKKQQRRSVALRTLSSNSIPLPHAFNVSITAKYMWDPRLAKHQNIKKKNVTLGAGAEGRPDLPGTNFNLYSACLYQRWLEPPPAKKNIPTSLFSETMTRGLVGRLRRPSLKWLLLALH